TRSKRDWSSDVCSSDLALRRRTVGPPAGRSRGRAGWGGRCGWCARHPGVQAQSASLDRHVGTGPVTEDGVDPLGVQGTEGEALAVDEVDESALMILSAGQLDGDAGAGAGILRGVVVFAQLHPEYRGDGGQAVVVELQPRGP